MTEPRGRAEPEVRIDPDSAFGGEGSQEAAIRADGEADEAVDGKGDDEADRVVAHWRDRIDRGEIVDPEAEIRAHPRLAERLRTGWAALRLLDRRYGLRSAAAEAPPAARLLGRTLGPFRLESVLGSGGMGTVFRAVAVGTVPASGTAPFLALKLIHPHLFDRPGFFKRFLREAEIGRRVRHANVVRTLDADEVVEGAERHRFLVMEYVEGRTLRSVLAEDGKLPEALCRHIGREVAGALAAIHAAGAVHRDVKPENVLLTKDHVVKLMDLGVARLADEAVRLSQSGVFVGSLLYGAPEQLRGEAEVDGRADLHALGLLLYELATDVHPFRHDDFRVVIRRIAEEPPRRCAELDPQLSPLFEDLVSQLLEKDPAKRPANAEDVARILGEGEESAWWRKRSQVIRTTTHRPLRRIRIPRETALYGRDAEIDRLRALFDRATAGDGQVVLLEGEAGIGKSRLISDLVDLLHREGRDLHFLFGGNSPGGAATASGAFTTAYREQFGAEGLETTLPAYLTPSPILVPAFAALLRGEPPPEGEEPLTKDSLQTVFVHATRALAAERPTIVLIEDLHFAPEEGRSLFAALAMAVPGHRVLLVGTARPGLEEKWLGSLDRLDQTTRMPLARLSPKDLAALLVDAFRSQRLAEELAFRIGTKSDGNPWFVFEIIRGLRDGQFLRQQPDGTWVTTRIIAEIEVPSTVRDLVFGRTGNLSTEERNLLDVAACAGFEFDPVLVGEVVGLAPIPALQRLAGIEKSHRLVRSAARRFVFDHHQVAEVLYDALPEVLREHYHASIAAAIEAQHGADAREPKDLDEALCVDLAEHFLKGGKGDRAVRYLDAALTHLEKNYLNDAAARLADRALSAPGILAGKERGGVLLRRAASLDALGRPDGPRRCLVEANALADATTDASFRAKARTAFGWYLHRAARTDEAQRVLVEAVAIARESGDRRSEAAATRILGGVARSLGHYDEARAHLERCLAMACEIGEPQLEATATGNLGTVFSCLGRHDEARAHHERQLAIAREIGDRRGEATATGNLGIVFCMLGRHDESRAHHERQLEIAREIGDRRAEATATGNLGIVFSMLGRFDEAHAHHVRCLAIAREICDRRMEAAATGNLGRVFGWLGRFDEARAHHERCLAIAREICDRRMEATATGDLGRVFGSIGRCDEARAHHERRLTIVRDIGERGSEAESLAELGATLVGQGLVAEAAGRLREAAALAEDCGDPSVRLLATAHLTVLPIDDRTTAVAAALDALTSCESGASKQAAMEARFLLWQATHDSEHLGRAKRLLDHLVEHAPEDCRESMLANVGLHREIAAAAREHGL